ncbi:MAG: phytanoyl-CoA dioxygenase family protein [Planctomycetota bacterium]|nr:phytanoyl-CoA dioxygenase family protein [Planctomycetota bacterium]MDA1137823.1 phytanoyl-CoA dioxygenase family protein [Planctomycetota bacterium]
MAEFTFPYLDGIADDYGRDGYVIVRQVLPPSLLAEIREHISWLMKRHPELPTESLGHWLIADDPFWVRFLSDGHLLDVAGAMVGPDIAFFAADYICKSPAKGRPVYWHQDAKYWPLEPMEVITVWFAVTESNRQNGGVRVIPGSHTGGLLPHESIEDEDNLLRTHVPSNFFDESSAIDLELEPGDISMHHPLTIHGSKKNTSDRWRMGGSIQYMPPTTRISHDDWPCPFMFRGKPDPEINSYKPFPKYVEGEHMPFAGCEKW